jgi:hypothetical protein
MVRLGLMSLVRQSDEEGTATLQCLKLATGLAVNMPGVASWWCMGLRFQRERHADNEKK